MLLLTLFNEQSKVYSRFSIGRDMVSGIKFNKSGNLKL